MELINEITKRTSICCPYTVGRYSNYTSSVARDFRSCLAGAQLYLVLESQIHIGVTLSLVP